MKSPVFYTTTPSIGDLICSTPTIRKIANVYKSKVIVVSPSPHLLKNSPYISQNLDIRDVDLSQMESLYDVHKSFHLLGKKDPLGIEFKHAMCDIRQFHSKDLGFMLTPDELRCDYFPDRFEYCMDKIDLPEKYVVIHPVQSWDSRTWEIEKWQLLCDYLEKEKIFVVALGKNSGEYSIHLQQEKPVFNLEIKYGIDLTNKTSIDQTWHILNKSRCVVTMDSGILHLAGTTDTNIIQLGSSIDPYFRAPYRNGSQKYKYSYVPGTCKIHCASDLFYSLRDWDNIQSVTLINTCLEYKKEFECKPGPQKVFEKVLEVLEGNASDYLLEGFYEREDNKMDFSENEKKIEDLKVEIEVHFRNGPTVEIKGDDLDPRIFSVKFIDQENDEIVHQSSIKINHWVKASRKYFTKWRIEVTSAGEKIHEEIIDLSNKKVMISLSSRAIGDSIAWLPYCEEFRKKHGCTLTVETPYFEIFSPSYPNIEWVQFKKYHLEHPDFYATYDVGYGTQRFEEHEEEMRIINRNYKSGRGKLFSEKLSIWDDNRSPRHPHSITLAENATDILGLEFKEIRPLLKNYKIGERPFEGKYVCISEFASSRGLKEWNNKVGWEKIVDKLISLGFKVVSISKEKSNLSKVIKRNGDFDLKERIWYLHNCEFFIGVCSGLSWLAWACEKKVVMISGATLEFTEFQEDNIRVINKEGCYGCWNSEDHRDKFACFHESFCPEGKNFECTRKISPSSVIQQMEEAKLI